MDENLTFFDTGERVDYAVLNEGATGRSLKIEPSQTDDLTHFEVIRKIFFTDNKQFSQRELTEKIEYQWNVSNKIARRFVDYYEQRKWITDISNTPNRCSYKSNIVL